MNRALLYLLIAALICACKTNSKDALQHLSGYWEIESVVLEDGSKKNYTYSNTIDYIQINDSLLGFRKKMKPLFDGTYETSKNREPFQLKIENDSLNLYYKTKYAKRKETVIKVSQNQLKIVNQNNIVYVYKRYLPIASN